MFVQCDGWCGFNWKEEWNSPDKVHIRGARLADPVLCRCYAVVIRCKCEGCDWKHEGKDKQQNHAAHIKHLNEQHRPGAPEYLGDGANGAAAGGGASVRAQDTAGDGIASGSGTGGRERSQDASNDPASQRRRTAGGGRQGGSTNSRGGCW